MWDTRQLRSRTYLFTREGKLQRKVRIYSRRPLLLISPLLRHTLVQPRFSDCDRMPGGPLGFHCTVKSRTTSAKTVRVAGCHTLIRMGTYLHQTEPPASRTRLNVQLSRFL